MDRADATRTEPLGLRWGVRRSFLSYVFGMPDGQASVGDGSRALPTEELCWEPDLRPQTDGWAFRGDVRFEGHAGLMFVRIADPWVARHGTRVELTVADPYGAPDAPRLVLATAELSEAEVTGDVQLWRGTDVRLTEDGSAVFNHAYPAGELFEPFTIVLASPSA